MKCKNYKNVTNNFINNNNHGCVKIYKDLSYYQYKNKKYYIDGKHVMYSFDENEDVFAIWLSNIIHKDIILLPKINYPERIKSADYRIGNKYYDLKTIYGNSNQVLYHKIRRSIGQANRFIFDIQSTCSLSLNDLEEQINKIFSSSRHDCVFVDMILLRYMDNLYVYKKLTAPGVKSPGQSVHT